MKPCRRLATALVLALLPACQTISKLNVFSEQEEATLGLQAYAEETGKYRVVTGTADAQMVERVGRKIAASTGKDYQWEFKLLDAPKVVNAFCLPGGKVAVYSGLLPVTQNEQALAVVLGHEVAHATQRHGGKRMTQGMLTEGLITAITAGLSLSKMDDNNKALVLGALGTGANVAVTLPFSREHETEADEVGIRYAIRSGYDPMEAPKLWQRMAALGSAGPEFLSTHPDPLHRAANLEQRIPQIVAEEQASAAQAGQKH
ncbi:MAG TPA: M48 family metallopeptidase [Planctomycetota bacterium]|nr:M48 family metallopeptidase [Planctomycetota bacterium]